MSECRQRNTVSEHFTGIHSIKLAVVYGCVLLCFCFKSGIFECYLIIWLMAVQTSIVTHIFYSHSLALHLPLLPSQQTYLLVACIATNI